MLWLLAVFLWSFDKLDRSQLRIFRISSLQIALNQLVIDHTKYNETRKAAGYRGAGLASSFWLMLLEPRSWHFLLSGRPLAVALLGAVWVPLLASGQCFFRGGEWARGVCLYVQSTLAVPGYFLDHAKATRPLSIEFMLWDRLLRKRTREEQKE